MKTNIVLWDPQPAGITAEGDLGGHCDMKSVSTPHIISANTNVLCSVECLHSAQHQKPSGTANKSKDLFDYHNCIPASFKWFV